MKISFELPDESIGMCIKIITRSLKARAPREIVFVGLDQADAVIEHTIGLPCIERAKRRAAGRPLVCWQHCLLTGGYVGHEREWQEFWQSTRRVVSTLELPCVQARLPIGIDFDFHKPLPTPKRYTALTTGYVSSWTGEPIVEVHDAVRRVGGDAVHVGGRCYSNEERVWRFEGISDAALCDLYRASHYVSALRCVEGYEMPGFEALACGVRPIVFDLPCYRYWYGDHAEYVPHGQRGCVEAVANVLAQPPRPVSQNELSGLAERLSWAVVARDFWGEVLRAT